MTFFAATETGAGSVNSFSCVPGQACEPTSTYANKQHFHAQFG